MIFYYDRRFSTISFGAEKFLQALKSKAVFCLERELKDFCGTVQELSVVACLEKLKITCPTGALEPGGFEIAVADKVIYVIGNDDSGVMYGLFDLAETVRREGLAAVKDKRENPFMKMRGVKFNLPFEPYDMGDPFEKNVETCLDPKYWEKYIDFLALNRYNCLSLWSEHPFHMMFRLAKYPQTCPYSDVELEKYQSLFHFIFQHARARGIDVYIITWNIRITPFIAEGMGLPRELGEMTDRYDLIYDHCNDLPNNIAKSNIIRQHSEVVKDYFVECIKTLVMTYRDLTGLGTSCSEEMAGDIVERHQWVVDTYLRAISEAKREIPFIHRTNSTNGKITKEIFIDKYPFKDKYISWKYSNAHMYSHPLPQFEKLWGAWRDMDLNDTKVIYTVRNDDFHTLRWGDPGFIRQYVKGMDRPYVHGFYWGADGYLWGEDFQHVPHGHKTWKYDFEKHWYEFELLGRMGYNPDLSDNVWIDRCKEHFGEAWGEAFYRAYRASSQIIPAVNRLFWINYDFEWHPESLLTVFGFKTVLDFVNGVAMPGTDTIGIREYVEKDLARQSVEGESPVDIINILKTSVQETRAVICGLEREIPKDYRGGEIECTLSDFEAWTYLGAYYQHKFQAALHLACYEKTGREDLKEQAIHELEQGLEAWKELGSVWSTHYMPYKMTRSKYIFGWPYYIRDVERDIELARNYYPGKQPAERPKEIF